MNSIQNKLILFQCCGYVKGNKESGKVLLQTQWFAAWQKPNIFSFPTNILAYEFERNPFQGKNRQQTTKRRIEWVSAVEM